MQNPNTHSERNNCDQLCCFRGLSTDGVRILLELNRMCTRNCRHCFINPNNNILPSDFWISIIDQIHHLKINVKKVILTGGEPLLHPECLNICSAIADFGWGIDLNTNADMLHKISLDEVRKHGVSEMSISLHGCKDFHDWLSRCPSYNLTFDHIKQSISHGFSVDVHGICVSANWNSYITLAEVLSDLGVSSLTLLNLLPNTISSANFYPLGTKETSEMFEWIFSYRSDSASSMPLRTRGFIEESSLNCQIFNNQFLAIDQNGILLPCIQASYQSNKTREMCDLTRFSVIEAIHTLQDINAKFKRNCYKYAD